MNVKFEARFSKDLRRIKDGSLLKRIKELITSCKEVESLAEIRQVKKLRGYDTFYRVRIGDYRIGWNLSRTSLSLSAACIGRKCTGTFRDNTGTGELPCVCMDKYLNRSGGLSCIRMELVVA